MLKGGYQIINLESRPITSGVGMQYDGIYEKIEGTSKVILISGLVVDGVEYHDAYVEPVVDGDSYLINCYGKQIRIYDNDVVIVGTSADKVATVDLKGATLYGGGEAVNTGINNLQELIENGEFIVFTNFVFMDKNYKSFSGPFFTSDISSVPFAYIDGSNRFTITGSNVSIL